MEGVPVPRWAIGFVAMRWRHVFWILPLAGMLAGLGLQLWNFYGPTVAGVVQVGPRPSTSPRILMKDAVDALESDTILSRTTASLELEKRWSTGPDACISTLRVMIRAEEIPGTSLIMVNVAGRSRTESIEIWNALALFLNEYFADKRSAAEEAKIAVMKAAVETSEHDLREKRKILSAILRRSQLVFHEPGTPANDEERALKARAKADVGTAQVALDKAKIALLSWEMSCRLTGHPVLIHASPSHAPRLMHRLTLRSLFHHAGLGLGIGVVVAAPLAYLLELLFPRKSRGLPGGT